MIVTPAVALSSEAVPQAMTRVVDDAISRGGRPVGRWHRRDRPRTLADL